ncbi:RNA-dependent RNA polymerase [Beihai rhabdo-like virus 6]|uniref:RNA-directed RNA polymerase n=1 Tax=Beihai rhabdo-like virus 6 TaxID=1922656 RepID=A0A1L3KMS7_9MONO|nr:RNA-dependent RNA polymerase [Beihai rhabdo-like virus 6]APG78639.1 RNA-dependent RNA polymerase [Beihai rhabdo-like virus 6]
MVLPSRGEADMLKHQKTEIMEEEVEWEEVLPVACKGKRVWRRESRVTSAITLSHLYLWDKGHSLKDLAAFASRHGMVKGEEFDRARDYGQYLYKHLWVPQKGVKMIEQRVISAAKILLSVSMLDWAGKPADIKLERLNESELLRKACSLRKHLDDMVEKVGNNTEQEIAFSFPEHPVVVHFFGDHAIIAGKEDRPLWVNWMALIAFRESIVGIIDALICSTVEDWENGETKTPGVERLIRTAIETHLTIGRKTYGVLKLLHAGAVGAYLEGEPWIENMLRPNVVSEIPECPLKWFFETQVRDFEETAELIALGGLSKIFTYPVVLIEESVQNVVTKSRRFDPDQTAGKRAQLEFRRHWFHTYLRKYKEWPPLRVVGDIPGIVQHSIDTGTWQESRDDPWYPAIFERIVPEKALEMNPQVDETGPLSDKAVACGLGSWPREFDFRYHPVLYGRRCNPGPMKERRLLVRHIKTSEVVVLEEAVKFMSESHSDSKMAVMCLKERELSEDKGRFFTKQTFEGRSYQTLVEENVKTILPFVPLTSMHLTGDAVVKVMLARSSDSESLKISIDFSKWCQYQRYGLIAPIAQDIDRILGSDPLIESTHMIPPGMWFFFQDSAMIPKQGSYGEPVPSDRAYFGAETLGEGMFQRLWTLVTACGIKHHLRESGVECDIVGSGDNQLLTCRLKRGETLAGLQRVVFDSLQRFSEISGLPIKLEETFSSCNYLEYGKCSYIHGKRVKQHLKKASRVGTESQETIPSTNVKLSGVMAAGIAVAAECSTPTAGYILAMMEAGFTLYARGFKGSAERLAAVLLLGRQLGGLKSSGYSSFCIRGISDTATTNMSVLQTALNHQSDYPGLCRELKKVPVTLGTLNWAQLFKDPFSLPFKRPRDSDGLFKSLVEEVLPVEATNKKIKILVGADAARQESRLVEDLKKMEPMSLKLCASLFEKSNVMIKEKIIGKFYTSSSILKLTESYTNFEQETLRAKESDKIALAKLASKGHNEPSVWARSSTCPTEVMTLVRQKLTGKALSFPSMAAPQHQVRVIRWSALGKDEVRRSLRVTVDPAITSFRTMRGPGPCYIGSDTKIKTRKSPLALIDPEPLDRSALSLATMRSWIGGCPRLTQLIDVLIAEKTYTPPDIVEVAADSVAGGVHDHRGQHQTASQGAHPNFDPTVTSYIRITSDSALDFARKGGDYSIMFQSVKVYITSVLLHRLQAGEDISGDWAGYLECDFCTAPVHEGDYVLTSYPGYRGFSLGSERHLRFRPKGRPFSEDRSVKFVNLSAHTYLAEMLVSQAAKCHDLDLQVEEERVGASGDFTVNTQASLSELARADMKMLILCVLQRVAIRPGLENYTKLLCNVRAEGKPYLNPIRYIMDPIVAAGRAPDLRSLSGSVTIPNYETEEGRVELFSYLFRRHMTEAQQEWGVLLSEDSFVSRKRASRLKADAMGSDPIVMKALNAAATFDDLEAVETYLGIETAIPPQIAQDHLRAGPMKDTLLPLCTLKTNLKGARAVQFGAAYNPSVSYGCTVFSSQVYTIAKVLPDLQAWVLSDYDGGIGIVVGHIRGPAYIHDPRSLRKGHARIATGPRMLFLDSCCKSYDRSYYVRALGTTVPPRPTSSPLLIISVKNPASHGVTVESDDVVLSRDPGTGGPMCGYPFRGPKDLWYCNEYILEPEKELCPEERFRFTVDSHLSPAVRLKEILGLDSLSYDNLRSSLQQKIDEALRLYRTEETRDEGATLQSLAEAEGRVSKSRSDEEMLTLIWLEWKLKGNTGKLSYHKKAGFPVHTKGDCDCNKVLWKEFRPRDQLLEFMARGILQITAVHPKETPLEDFDWANLYT